MFRIILLILLLAVLIPAITCFIRNRDRPGARRWCVILGIIGLLLAPSIALFLCELISSVVSVLLFFFIIFAGFALLFRALFR